jgi:hypothetical protein
MRQHRPPVSVDSPARRCPRNAHPPYRLNHWEVDVAKGQLRSNREKKKPKAEKNKVKAAPATSAFATPRSAGTAPRGKGGKTST